MRLRITEPTGELLSLFSQKKAKALNVKKTIITEGGKDISDD